MVNRITQANYLTSLLDFFRNRKYRLSAIKSSTKQIRTTLNVKEEDIPKIKEKEQGPKGTRQAPHGEWTRKPPSLNIKLFGFRSCCYADINKLN